MVVMETLNTFQPRTFTPAFLGGDTEGDRYRPRAYTPAPGETAGGQTDGQKFVPHTFTPAYISEELDEMYEEEERQRPWL
ncbi:hypothetical protein MAR_010236 [Mya arenaria]|uniref:Uncharacterized protein n=1 Tax=Mya arenaria TaxID=6604 RepID=A0ABY7E116_MYAAR|nr:hypothetical protein MAR_010236 [Mya arenaria]